MEIRLSGRPGGAADGTAGGDTISGLPTRDLRITSTAPTPGDPVTYTMTAAGHDLGPGAVSTEMDNPDVPGVTVVDAPIKVVAGGG